MNPLAQLPTFAWRLLLAAALVAAVLLTDARADGCAYVTTAPPLAYAAVAAPQPASWVFARSRYTHDPDTNGRVAQFAMKPPVEPLSDPRAVSSGYSRTRQVLRGADGSVDTYYRVQSYGNGRGGQDASWERLHDAWRGATVAGGDFFATQAPWGGGYWNGGGYGVGQPGYGFGQPGYRVGPRQQFGPGTGRPDAGRLDPDGADGYHDGNTRTPDRQFFNRAVPQP